MNIIETIKKGFSVATKNLPLVGVVIAFNLIWNLGSIPFAGQQAAPTPQISAGAIIFSIIFILLSIFVQGGSLGLVRDYIKQGKLSLPNFTAYGLKYYAKLLLLGLIIVAIIVVVAFIATMLIAITAPANNAVLTAIVSIIAIAIGAFGIYWLILLMMSPYSLISEETSVIESLKRSIKAVKKAIGKVVLLLVLLILISIALGFIIGLLTGLITVVLPPLGGQILMAIVNSIFNGYFGIVMMASFFILYFAISEKPSTEKVF